jgi:hypothetical protein
MTSVGRHTPMIRDEEAQAGNLQRTNLQRV